MKRKNRLKMVVFLLLLGGCGYFLSRWLTGPPSLPPAMESRKTVHSTTTQPPDQDSKQLAQDSEQRSKSQDPWLASQNKMVEIHIEKFRENGVQLTPKEKDDLRASIAATYKEIRAAGGKIPVPNPDDVTITTTRKFTKPK